MDACPMDALNPLSVSDLIRLWARACCDWLLVHLQAALKSEYSHLKTDLEDRTVEPTLRGVLDFDVACLQRTPPQSTESEDDTFDEEY
jgi:hypothetical protein